VNSSATSVRATSARRPAPALVRPVGRTSAAFGGPHGALPNSAPARTPAAARVPRPGRAAARGPSAAPQMGASRAAYKPGEPSVARAGGLDGGWVPEAPCAELVHAKRVPPDRRENQCTGSPPPACRPCARQTVHRAASDRTGGTGASRCGLPAGVRPAPRGRRPAGDLRPGRTTRNRHDACPQHPDARSCRPRPAACGTSSALRSQAGRPGRAVRRLFPATYQPRSVSPPRRAPGQAGNGRRSPGADLPATASLFCRQAAPRRGRAPIHAVRTRSADPVTVSVAPKRPRSQTRSSPDAFLLPATSRGPRRPPERRSPGRTPPARRGSQVATCGKTLAAGVAGRHRVPAPDPPSTGRPRSYRRLGSAAAAHPSLLCLPPCGMARLPEPDEARPIPARRAVGPPQPSALVSDPHRRLDAPCCVRKHHAQRQDTSGGRSVGASSRPAAGQPGRWMGFADRWRRAAGRARWLGWSPPFGATVCHRPERRHATWAGHGRWPLRTVRIGAPPPGWSGRRWRPHPAPGRGRAADPVALGTIRTVSYFSQLDSQTTCAWIVWLRPRELDELAGSVR
jgi:hypothetical protein